MIKVYIASPYSKGDKNDNVRKHMKAANELIEAGFAPYIPLLMHFQNMVFPQPESKWLELDLEYLPMCDCVLRLEGESDGADVEVKEAWMRSIPVFNTVKEVIDRYTFVRLENGIIPTGF